MKKIQVFEINVAKYRMIDFMVKTAVAVRKHDEDTTMLERNRNYWEEKFIELKLEEEDAYDFYRDNDCEIIIAYREKGDYDVPFGPVFYKKVEYLPDAKLQCEKEFTNYYTWIELRPEGYLNKVTEIEDKINELQKELAELREGE